MPPGMLGTVFQALDPDSIESAIDSARYVGDNGEGATVDWTISTSVLHHATSTDPLNYSAADFTLTSVVTYVDTDGDPWGLFAGPSDWTGTPLLSETEIPTLQIARRHLGKPANKERSIVLNPMSLEICGGNSVPFPFFEDPSVSFLWGYTSSLPVGLDGFADTPIEIGAQVLPDIPQGTWKLNISKPEGTTGLPLIRMNQTWLEDVDIWEFLSGNTVLATVPRETTSDIVSTGFVPGFPGEVIFKLNGREVYSYPRNGTWEACGNFFGTAGFAFPGTWQGVFFRELT